MKSETVETIVGAAVIAAALAFLLFVYRTAGVGGPTGGYHVLAQFDNIEGVSVGTDVRVAGIKVGSVIGQSLDAKSFQAHIDMLIQPQVLLSDDSSAKITSEGLLGAKFVSLEPGGSETKLANGGEITYTQGAVDMWSLISQAMFSKSTAKVPEAGASGGDSIPKQ